MRRKILAYSVAYAIGIAAAWMTCKYAVDEGMMHAIPSVQDLLLWGGLAPAGLFYYMAQLPPKQSSTEISPDKRKAMYPAIPTEYLSDTPEGLILGKHRKKYVRIPLTMNNILHGIILGSPGSSKSSGPLICTLLAVFKKNRELRAKGEKPVTCFVIDAKPELAYKSVRIRKNRHVRVVNITDRDSWGWDVYYELNESSTDDEIWLTMDGISRALVISANSNDEFFVDSARTVLQGMLIYYFKCGKGFIDAMQLINEKDVQKHIGEILKDTTNCAPGSIAYALLNKYADKDSEAMQDIAMTMSEHISIFMESNVVWALRDSPKRACPRDINRGKSLFLAVPESKLDHYSSFLRLATNQFFGEMQKRNEQDDNGVVLGIIDEMGRIGKIEKLKEALATGRCRGLSCWMAYQDQSQLESIYGKNDARTIQNLCEVTAILSCKDGPTTEMISGWAGKYRETKKSVKKTGQNKGDETESYEMRDIVETSDIQSLRKSEEVMLFIEGLYFRTRRIRYFEDPILSKWSTEIQAYNAKEVQS